MLECFRRHRIFPLENRNRVRYVGLCGLLCALSLESAGAGAANACRFRYGIGEEEREGACCGKGGVSGDWCMELR